MPSIFSKVALIALAFGLAQALPKPQAPAPQPSAVDNSELIAKLKTDPTAYLRFKRLLTENGELISGDKLAKATVFDFNGGGATTGAKGGVSKISTAETFPILVGSGLAMTRAGLGPCGVFAPHVHPRSSEYFVTVEGEIEFGTTIEIGLPLRDAPIPEVTGKMATNEGTLFPQGSIHWQINNSQDCKNATAFVLFSEEDPGVTPVLQMPAGANFSDPDDVRAVLPPAIAKTVTTCLARCYPSKV